MAIEFSIRKIKAPRRFQQKILITIDMCDRQPILSSIDMHDRQSIYVLTCVTDNLFLSFSYAKLPPSKVYIYI